jgi:hypothetical protein
MASSLACPSKVVCSMGATEITAATRRTRLVTNGTWLRLPLR